MAYKDPRQKAFEDKVFEALKNGMDFPLEFKSWLRSYLELNPPAFLPSDLATIIKGTDIDVDSLQIERLFAGDITGANVQVGKGSQDDGSGNAIADNDFTGIRSYADPLTLAFLFDTATGNAYLKGRIEFGDGSFLDENLIDVKEQTGTGMATPAVVQTSTNRTTGGGSSPATCTWSSSTTSGNGCYMFLLQSDPDGVVSDPTNPSGWSRVFSIPFTGSWGATSMRLTCWVATTTTRSGTESITLGDTSYWAVCLMEVSGVVPGTAGVDKTATNSGHTSAADTGSTAATTQAEEICIAVFGIENKTQSIATAGYVQKATVGGTSSGTVVARLTAFTKNVLATGVQSAAADIIDPNTFATTIDFWGAGILTVKAATAVPDPATPSADTYRVFAKDLGGESKLYGETDKGYITEIGVPTGAILPYAGSGAPDSGWLLCAGQSLLRTDYPALFAVIGTTYGAVDGTHFTLPDLRGRVPVALDNLGGTDAGRLTVANTLGGSGGEQDHTLTTGEIPSHTHVYRGILNTNTQGGGSANRISNLTNTGDDSGTSDATGGSGSHNNMQPYILLNYIIKV